MTQLSINKSLEDGIELDSAGLVAATAAGDKFKNDGNTVLIVKNINAAARTVNIAPQNATQSVAGKGKMTKPAVAKSVSIDKLFMFGPFEPGEWNDGNGDVLVTYSADVGVTVGAFQLPKSHDRI